MDKSNLDPLRLLHFLALAVLAVWLVPPNRRGLTATVMRGAILCGKNSLPIYCLGVLLTLVSVLALLDVSEGLAMQIALSVAGVLMMIVAATLLNLIKIRPSQQLTVAVPMGVRAEQEGWGAVGWRAWSRFAEGQANSDGPAARTSSPISGLRRGQPRKLPDLLDEFGRAQGGWASPKPAARAAKDITATVPVGI